MAMIQTYTGRMVDLEYPRPEDIHIIDIAHALSNICRFGGHTDKFYSVAQHSCYVALHVPEPLAFYGLLHDAGEAYMGDVVHPLKVLLPFYSKLEEGILRNAIYPRFRLEWPTPAEVEHVDYLVLMNERRDLLRHERPWADLVTPLSELDTIIPWTPEQAEMEFMSLYDDLYTKHIIRAYLRDLPTINDSNISTL